MNDRHDPQARRTFEEEYLFGEATDTLIALVESAGIRRKDLAERIGVSSGRVSQMLSGGSNLTLRSLAALGWALGIRFELHPTPVTDRQGTPAENDPQAPPWLDQLGEQASYDYSTTEHERWFEKRPMKPKLVVVDAELNHAA